MPWASTRSSEAPISTSIVKVAYRVAQASIALGLMRTSQGLRRESELRAFDVSCLQRKQVMLGAIQEISMPHALQMGQLSYHLRMPPPCARPLMR